MLLLDRYAPLLAYDSRETFYALAVDGTANTIYGRLVMEGDDRWLQYWCWYTCNWSRFKGRHDGDWEMIQLRLGPDDVPDLAVFAQHARGEQRPWGNVLLWVNTTAPGDGFRFEAATHPVVFVARGTHASYFTLGHHRRTRVSLDRANGNGRRVIPSVWPPPADGWATERPKWGRDKHSPMAPGRHQQWTQPSRWAARLR